MGEKQTPGFYNYTHGPFLLRVWAHEADVADIAQDYLEENKFFGVDFDSPLALNMVERFDDPMIEQRGLYREARLMSLVYDNQLASNHKIGEEKHAALLNQGQLFRPLFTVAAGVTLEPDPHFD